jgi:hypothetical protein
MQLSDVVERQSIHPGMALGRVVAAPRLEVLQETDHARAAETFAESLQTLLQNLIGR